MERIEVYFEEYENWVDVDRETNQPVVERRNIRQSHGYVVDTFVKNVDMVGWNKEVPFFIVAKPDGTFVEVEVSACKHVLTVEP